MSVVHRSSSRQILRDRSESIDAPSRQRPVRFQQHEVGSPHVFFCALNTLQWRSKRLRDCRPINDSVAGPKRASWRREWRPCTVSNLMGDPRCQKFARRAISWRLEEGTVATRNRGGGKVWAPWGEQRKIVDSHSFTRMCDDFYRQCVVIQIGPITPAAVDCPVRDQCLGHTPSHSQWLLGLGARG